MSFVWPTSHVGMAHPLSPERNAREIGYDFLKMADSALRGISYSDSKHLLSVSAHQAETRKSLFEELGFLYVPERSNSIILTAIGQQIIELLGIAPGYESSGNLVYQTDKIICWSLMHVQINRLQSRGSPRPAIEDWTTCDVKPYATFWKAALDLDGYITMPEFFGVIRQLKNVDDYPSAIAKIKNARAKGLVLFDSTQYQNRAPLMNPRIYWNSHLSVGGSVFEFDKASDSLVLKHDRKRLIQNLFALFGSDVDPFAAIRAKEFGDIHEYYSRFSRADLSETNHTAPASIVTVNVIPSLPATTSEIFVDPPVIKKKPKRGISKTRVARKIDYAKQDVENQILGVKGEEYVVKIEQLRLRQAGHSDLADLVKWVSKDEGDGLGYDIESFTEDRKSIQIEVKTTNSGITAPFYISDSEVSASNDLAESYVLYRVFDFSNTPRIYKLYSPIENYVILEPVTFRASIKPVAE